MAFVEHDGEHPNVRQSTPQLTAISPEEGIKLSDLSAQSFDGTGVRDQETSSVTLGSLFFNHHIPGLWAQEVFITRWRGAAHRVKEPAPIPFLVH
jgi:hypothetical protein